MDLAWDDHRTRKFVTTIGLITSDGPYGRNVMAAEWAYHVSYAPSLIVACIGQNKATAENIKKTKMFGVSIAASDQSIIASVAGGSSGKNVDKINVLKDMGIEFYEGAKVKVPLVKNAAMNAECKLVKSINLGDHIMFVGEVVEIVASSREPIVYHNSKYWKFGEQVQKPSPEMLGNIGKLVEKHQK